MTVLNLIVWRIRDLLHKPGGGVSNSAVRIQKLWEVYRSGITPEDNISETIHSRALHYEYIVTDA